VTRNPKTTVMQRHRARLRAKAAFAAAVHSLAAEPVADNVVRYLLASRALEEARWQAPPRS
jgi:hypothetical protein